ncbi:murein biosynthesis integral membrane protein MurJ [Candidatus Gottesmanbacteria bacterium]|nr:murein biosynthesis integral membrane protein MurJ [Candidatus Gottesmanbacteria bacterium]
MMIRRLLKAIFEILSLRQTSIIGAAFVIMVTVFISRVLGLIRDRMLVARFSPDELGVYFAAFRLPNLVFELLVMGAISAAFIPVFTDYLTEEKRKEAWQLASSVINIGLLAFGLLAIPIFIFSWQVCRLIAPGFNDSQLSQMVIFTRIMLLAQVFPLIIGNFLTGISQSFKHFLIPSLAPVVYNLGIILGILFLTPFLGLFGPVFGVVLGAILFMVVQIPLVRSLGFSHFWVLNFSHPGVREVGRLMLPRTFGLAVSQIDTTVDLILSTLLGARMVTIFNFAQHLQQLPIGLFGVTIAQAALPTMAQLKTKKNLEDFKNIFLSSMHQVLFLILPVSAILIVLRIPVVRLVFGASRFDWEATVLTGKTLALFSISLFAQAIIHLLVRGFYALYDSKTPVVIGIIAVFINTVLSIFFVLVLKLPVWGLALSTSIASIVNAILLLLFLDWRVKKFNRIRLILPGLKMFIASFITGIFLYVPMKLLDQLVFDTTRTINLIFLTGIATSIGLSVYLFLAWFLRIEEIVTFFNLAKKISRAPIRLIETSQEVVNGGK